MNILIKTTIRNIFGKPFRSLLVIFSIFACSIAALFCFDLAIVDSQFMSTLLSSKNGNGDFVITGKGIDIEKIPDDFPEFEYVLIRNYNDLVYQDVEGEYYISTVERARICSVNMDDAVNMGLIDPMELGDGQIIVTEAFSNLYGCEEGDTITIHDYDGDLVNLEVVSIIPTGTVESLKRGRTGIVNEATGDILFEGASEGAGASYTINILDDSRVGEAESKLHDIFLKADISRSTMGEGSDASTREMMGFMTLLFVIAFLLVIFITASLCERIVSERMSFIGTLRSLGLSARATGLILLIENVFYALMGSVPGVILYILLRLPFLSLLFPVNLPGGIAAIVPPLSPVLVVCVILGAVLIECIIPLRAQFKALKVSIRDIIFDNRDTEYKFSKFGITTGIIMAVVALISFFFRSDIFAAAICLVSSVLAVSFLFPLLIVKLSRVIANGTRRADQERWSLAAVEAGSRKSAVGSGILSVTSSAMCIIVLMIAISIMGYFKADPYDCDVVITANSDASNYAFVDRMDDVTESEIIYYSYSSVQVGEEEFYGTFYGLPDEGFRMFRKYADIPSVIESGQIAVSSFWAEKRGYAVGDVLTLTFDPNGVFPTERRFTITGLIKSTDPTDTTTAFMVSNEDYLDMFHGMPGEVLIRCENPDTVASMIDTYGVGIVDDVKTVEQMRLEQQESSRSIVSVFVVIIIVALGMTVIGMVSNQLIGFDGRKKECAVMLSTSMSKKTLIGILFRESFLTAAISVTTGILVGGLMVYVVKSALMSSDVLYMPVYFNPLYAALLWIGMILLFAFTVLFPIRGLNKMKLSEQIKCD